jgi:hypothetical protein
LAPILLVSSHYLRTDALGTEPADGLTKKSTTVQRCLHKHEFAINVASLLADVLHNR